mmetsp:Transcript_6573/g.7284  ORF Transcript_6573/g.7284 Transcript_6573/m.7284 type:complete len:158 (+) Transcript_6573:171-644(+)
MLRGTSIIIGMGTKSSVEILSRRLLSSAPSLVSSIEVTKSSLSSYSSPSRLEALREQLANEDARLDDFAGERRSKSVIIRKKAPPRNAKILPKPKWLRVKPAASDNYHKLRKTVRELGLATGTMILHIGSLHSFVTITLIKCIIMGTLFCNVHIDVP